MILHCTFCAVRVRVSYKVPAIGRALLCSPGLAYLLSREGGRYLRAGGDTIVRVGLFRAVGHRTFAGDYTI